MGKSKNTYEHCKIVNLTWHSVQRKYFQDLKEMDTERGEVFTDIFMSSLSSGDIPGNWSQEQT